MNVRRMCFNIQEAHIMALRKVIQQMFEYDDVSQGHAPFSLLDSVCHQPKRMDKRRNCEIYEKTKARTEWTSYAPPAMFTFAFCLALLLRTELFVYPVGHYGCGSWCVFIFFWALTNTFDFSLYSERRYQDVDTTRLVSAVQNASRTN